MPCDSVRQSPKQTLAQRAKQVQEARRKIDRLLAVGAANMKVDKTTGAVVFVGIPDDVRAGITDACVYRAIMTKGSHAAKQAIAKAERLSGRRVNKQAVNSGLHSHDGGATWGRD
jgi:hypothetical protein